MRSGEGASRRRKPLAQRATEPPREEKAAGFHGTHNANRGPLPSR